MMKESMSREGWSSHDLLPEGWIHKRIGLRIGFITTEGEFFTSLKSTLHFLKNEASYTEIEVKKFEMFMKLCHTAISFRGSVTF